MRVDCLIPSYRSLNPGPFTAILTMLNYSREQGVDTKVPGLFRDGIIQYARNASLRGIRKNADFVLFVDDDMVPEKDHLCRLLKHNLPVVSALTTTRGLPVKLTMKAYDRARDIFCAVEDVKPDTVARGDVAAGTGFLLVKKSVIDSVRENYLSANDWLFDQRARLDRMGVTAETREDERKRISDKRCRLAREHGVERVFEFYRNDEEYELGEDVSFCRRILLLGIPIAVDSSVQVGHCGEYTFGPWNLENDNDSERDTAGNTEAAGPGADGEEAQAQEGN